jgi:hypothetical protein
MFDPVNGAQRTAIPAATAEQLQRAGVLVVDHRRSRPLWFDGRFLAARDLNREQDYFLTRQADLAEAAGAGVAEGLLVSAGDNATELRITPGHGVASGGVRVEIPPLDAAAGTGGDLVLDLAALAEQTQLNAALGLGGEPAVPDRVRSGLFVVALRPVEFTSGPLGRYPTQPGDTRGMQDGETVEAALVTLLPFRDRGAQLDDHLRRSAVAQQLFLDGGDWQPPGNCLPLALVRLERNQLRWVDQWLLRRPLGEARSDPLGLGLAPRPVRLAFLRQYQAQLAEVMAERVAAGGTLRFPATESFVALPPAGPLPVQAIADDGDTLVQHYFPAEMDVDLAVVPSDELATVLEESFLLPPIPLTGTTEELAATGVLVLLPVARSELSSVARRPVAMRRPVPAASSIGGTLVGLGAATRNWQTLADLNLRIAGRTQVVSRWLTETGAERMGSVAGALADVTTADVAGADPAAGEQLELPLDRWRALLAGATTLWYVRRRNLSFKDSLGGLGRQVIPDEAGAEDQLATWLKDVKLAKPYADAQAKATSSGKQRLFTVLSAKAKADDEIGARAALTAIQAGGKYDEASIAGAAAPFADPATGAAVKAIAELVLEPELKPDGTPNAAVIERNRGLRAKLADPATVLTLRKVVDNVSGDRLDVFASELKASLKDSREKVAAKVQELAANL